jgi:adenylate cyclase class IV
MKFLEIEHKFVVSSGFDIDAFVSRVRKLAPNKDYITSVTDTYYLLDAVPNLVYRHRFDGLIQHLTAKSVSSTDSEKRLEVNLHLDLSDQSQNVRAFLSPLGIQWSGTLEKKVQVFYFDEVEVVYYQASYLGSQISCIELEASSPLSLGDAQRSLIEWETKLGLVPSERSHQSLLHLLVLPTLPDDLKAKISAMG